MAQPAAAPSTPWWPATWPATPPTAAPLMHPFASATPDPSTRQTAVAAVASASFMSTSSCGGVDDRAGGARTKSDTGRIACPPASDDESALYRGAARVFRNTEYSDVVAQM